MGEQQEEENSRKSPTIVERWRGRSLRENAGSGDGREGNNRGYGRVPNEDRSDIGKQDIDFGNGLDDGKSGRLDDSEDGWKEEEPVSGLQSTRT